MESNHHKNLNFNHGESGEIIPAAFAKKKKKNMKEAIWDEHTLKEASDGFKDQYVEEVALNAAQAVLRTLATAGLCDLDGDDVLDIVHMLQTIKAVASKSCGIDHPFHSVTQKIIAAPDEKTREFIGYMVMSADGSLKSNRYNKGE